jgi:hypothetical protein
MEKEKEECKKNLNCWQLLSSGSYMCQMKWVWYTMYIPLVAENKTGNVRTTYHWGAFADHCCNGKAMSMVCVCVGDNLFLVWWMRWLPQPAKFSISSFTVLFWQHFYRLWLVIHHIYMSHWMR